MGVWPALKTVILPVKRGESVTATKCIKLVDGKYRAVT